MMFSRFYNANMMMSVSASCSNAGTSCAHSENTCMTSANSMILFVMDAILASIIICALISILALNLCVLLAILVLVGLVICSRNMPWRWKTAT